MFFLFFLSWLLTGALVFLMVWFLFLLIWSIPICLIEYGVGRYTRVSTIESFAKLLGPSYRFLGGFIAGTSLFIGWGILNKCHWLQCSLNDCKYLYRSFYSVLLGYCCYYSFFFMVTELPDNLETATSHFDDLLVIILVVPEKSISISKLYSVIIDQY